MWVKFLIIFVLSIEALSASEKSADERKISYSVDKIWQSYSRAKKGNVCSSQPENDEFKQGVQEFYDGCRRATWKFRGRSYGFADNVMISMEDYFSKLMYFSNSNSTVLPSSSAALLVTMAKCNKFRKTSLIIMWEYRTVLPELITDFNEITTKLVNIIGQKLSCTFNQVVIDLGDTFLHFIKEFFKGIKNQNRIKVGYEKVFKKTQILMNTVALIAETVVNKCDTATRDLKEAVAVLTLIYYYFVIATQGTNSCVQDYQIANNLPVTRSIQACSESFEYVLVETGQAIANVVFTSPKSIEGFLTILVNVAMAFNTAVKDVLGSFEGVPLTVQEITTNLSKCTDCTTLVKNGWSNILKGITPK
ncbi:hypothetical protein Bhyg_08716 [Pseudolycoriella hygida]|uniref:Uncharacterized protein n=1 Tax=Pseudolycoriella hygida TaxID=35572 RepID=A0A9Q0N664_9DIPT|nr:hypothetical protein Bhyg_08716 [Pseudolycoriella hygida]